ncbi:MAG: metallophosphoesterase family protein [Clostridiales bacterium]|nr:metallophosphoesterase family protein [Clostridiales bacterium]
MNIFSISDIHGEIKFIDKAAAFISDADIVTIAGDISKDGTSKSADKIISEIEKYNKNIIAVHGNWDREDVQDFLEERGYSVHGKGRVVNDVAFFGSGGSNRTPMKTPSEYSEEKIKETLISAYDMVKDSKKKILISHSPPKGIKDRTFLGIKAGSSALTEFIAENKIDLILCGHIHEAHGIKKVDSLFVANSGSFKKGRYISVNFDDVLRLKNKRIK